MGSGTTARPPRTWRRWCRRPAAPQKRRPSRWPLPGHWLTGPSPKAVRTTSRSPWPEYIQPHPVPPREEAPEMADFTAEVYQNEFLPDGGTDVHAIVTVTCTGAGAAGQVGEGDAAEIVIVETSGSMGAVTIRPGQHETTAAIGTT